MRNSEPRHAYPLRLPSIIGFLNKEGNNYGLTADSAMFLDKHLGCLSRRHYRIHVVAMLIDPFRNFAEAVRKGATTMPEGGTVSHDNPIWGASLRARWRA